MMSGVDVGRGAMFPGAEDAYTRLQRLGVESRVSPAVGEVAIGEARDEAESVTLDDQVTRDTPSL